MTQRSEILARMKAYDEDRDARKAAYYRECNEYGKKLLTASNSIYRSILLGLGLHVHTDKLRVHIRNVSNYSTTVEVRYTNSQDEEVALAWKMTITYHSRTNETEISTGSLSSLSCNSKELVADLNTSAEILYRLNDMNWQEVIVNATDIIPCKSDIIKTEYNEDEERPDFEKELLECDLDEAANHSIWFKLLPKEGKIEKSSNNIYVKVEKVTPSMYTVTEGVYDSTFKTIWTVGSYSIRKDRLLKKLENPTIIIDKESK